MTNKVTNSIAVTKTTRVSHDLQTRRIIMLAQILAKEVSIIMVTKEMVFVHANIIQHQLLLRKNVPLLYGTQSNLLYHRFVVYVLTL